MPAAPPRILVVGAGAIGGTVAGHLAAAGADVLAVTTNPAIHAAVAARGFRLTGATDARTVPGRVSLGLPPDADGRFDLILLATQPPQVEAAARDAARALAPGGHMVCFQNGLCESRIAAIVGRERVVGAIVAWGASMPEPGLYDRTSTGGFTVGRLDGRIDDVVRRVADVLGAIGPATVTANLAGARWSKLAINCAISSLGTIAGAPLGTLIRVRRYRRLALEIFAEVVAVARAEGVRLEKVAGTIDLEWLALGGAARGRTASPGLVARHAVLLAVGLRYRRLRSSMLAAIERGRPPAVDFLNGEVTSRARAHGLDAPVDQRIVELVHDLAAGRARPSFALLDRLYAETPRLTTLAPSGEVCAPVSEPKASEPGSTSGSAGTSPAGRSRSTARKVPQ
jgi:2-dehydropantoate 2-reductase